MSLVVETNYANGVPQTAVPNFLPGGIAWHWTAGATGRAGALGTIQHFINTRYTVNASYHILLFREGTNTVAMWIVPPTVAAHSINPADSWKFNATKDHDFQATNFDDVRRILGPKASDPNAGCIAVSFCGMPDDLDEALDDPGFIADVRALARQLEAIPSMAFGPHFNHGWIQPLTRYDAGEELIWMLPESDSTPAPVQTFLDVPPSHPFYDAIEWMAREGIAKGYADGTFRPEEPLTAGRFAAFLERYDKSPADLT